MIDNFYHYFFLTLKSKYKVALQYIFNVVILFSNKN